MSTRIPHAIPYQGSKRALAPTIGRFIPRDVTVFYEPFAGSAAMSIFVARHRLAKRIVVADKYKPIVELFRAIVEAPATTADLYRKIWNGQKAGDTDYFNRVRTRFNMDHDPIDLLYLICRCVKNAVRFSASGAFTQSVDKRRLGMHPDRMEAQVKEISTLLSKIVEFRVGDWLQTTDDVSSSDFVYLDPPYLGTTIGPDKRYHNQILQEALVDGLRTYRARGIRFALSYDGRTGDKEYGPALPGELGLVRLWLHAGASSQATLNGKRAETIESLYLTPGLAEPTEEVLRTRGPIQCSFVG